MLVDGDDFRIIKVNIDLTTILHDICNFSQLGLSTYLHFIQHRWGKIELTYDSMRKNYAYSRMAWRGKSVEANSLQRLILHANFISSLLLVTVLLSSCATPHIQPTDTQLLLKSELLGFVQDGITTREEVILKLGIPSAQFEGEKILTYQLGVDQTGRWHLVAPQINATTGLRQWREKTCSLVLVFDGEGVLRKHSLVEAK